MKARIFLVIAACLGLFCFICYVFKGEIRHEINKVIKDEAVPLLASSEDYHGIDISHHQKDIDWEKVAEDKNIQFVYIKATEGATHKDRKYDENINGARKHGLKVGSYHYFRTTSSAHEQFENFKKHAKKADQDLIPIVDVEERSKWTKAQFQDSLKVFIGLVKEHYGKAPMIYSVNSFYNKNCAPEFNNYHLMIGRYGTTAPFLIKGTGTYTIWQYSETGTVNGINKPVDLNRFHPNHSVESLLLK